MDNDRELFKRIFGYDPNTVKEVKVRKNQKVILQAMPSEHIYEIVDPRTYDVIEEFGTLSSARRFIKSKKLILLAHLTHTGSTPPGLTEYITYASREYMRSPAYKEFQKHRGKMWRER